VFVVLDTRLISYFTPLRLQLIFLFLIWFWLDAVMQFGGQHPAGMGVPAVGMAFPGYVPGKSEMTWYRYIL
jgi:hypothetical protein